MTLNRTQLLHSEHDRPPLGPTDARLKTEDAVQQGSAVAQIRTMTLGTRGLMQRGVSLSGVCFTMS